MVLKIMVGINYYFIILLIAVYCYVSTNYRLTYEYNWLGPAPSVGLLVRDVARLLRLDSSSQRLGFLASILILHS